MDLNVYNTIQPVFVKFNDNENLPQKIRGKYMLHLIIPNIKLKSGIPAIYLELDVKQEKLELFLYQVSQDNSLLYRGTSDFVRNEDYYLNNSLYEYLGENDIFYTKIENIISKTINTIITESIHEDSIFGATIENVKDNILQYKVITDELNIKNTLQVNNLINNDFVNILNIIHTVDVENIVELIYNNVVYTYKENDYISDNNVTLTEILNKEIKEEIISFAKFNNLLEYTESKNKDEESSSSENYGSNEDSFEYGSNEFGSDESGSSENCGSDEDIINPFEGTIYTKEIKFNFNGLDSIIFDINIDCEEIVEDKIVEIVTEIINSEELITVGNISSELNKITDDIFVEEINEINVLDTVMKDIMNIVDASESFVNSIYYNGFIYQWHEEEEKFINPDNNILLEDSIYNIVIKDVFGHQNSIADFSVKIDDLYFNYDDEVINENEAVIIIVNTKVKTKDIYSILDENNVYYTYLDNHNIERLFDGEVITNVDGTYSGYVNKGYVKLMNKENGTYTYLVNGSEYIYLGNYIELEKSNFVGSVFILVPLIKHSKLFDNVELEEEEEEDEAIPLKKDISFSLPNYYDETFKINTEYFDIFDWNMEILAKYFYNKNKLLNNVFTEEELNNFYSTFCKTILEYTQILPENLLTTNNQIYKKVLEYYSTFMEDNASISINLILNSLFGTSVSNSNCGCNSNNDINYNTTTCYNLYKNAMQTYLTNMLTDINFYKDWFFIILNQDKEVISYPNDILIDKLITLIKEFIMLNYDLSFDTNTNHNCNCPIINTDTSNCNYTIFDKYINVLKWVKNEEITKNTNKIKIYSKEFSVLLPKLQF